MATRVNIEIEDERTTATQSTKPNLSHEIKHKIYGWDPPAILHLTKRVARLSPMSRSSQVLHSQREKRN
jgi:hypothetical protein